MMFNKFLFIVTLLFTCMHGLSQNTGQKKFYSIGLFWDQEYLLEKIKLKKLNEDRNYTNGLGFYYSSHCLNKWVIFKPQDWLIKKINPKLKDHISINSIMLANGSFTPDSITDPNPIYNDRPFSSLTYLQTNSNYLYVSEEKHRMYSISVAAGILGSGISRVIQTRGHEILNYDTPRGWYNQISSGGSPTILFGYQQDYLITTKPIVKREKDSLKNIRRVGGEWKAAWRANIGWYNMVSGEISYRFGWIDPRNWTYITNQLGSSNKDLQPISSEKKLKEYYDKPAKGEIFLFSTLRTNFVGYNALLSGQGGADPVRLSNKDVRRGVLEGTVGLCISPVIFNSINIDLKGEINARSPEFQAEGRKPRWHYWGGIDLLLTFLCK